MKSVCPDEDLADTYDLNKANQAIEVRPLIRLLALL